MENLLGLCHFDAIEVGGLAKSIGKLLKLAVVASCRVQNDPVVDCCALQELKITGVPAALTWLSGGGLTSAVIGFNSLSEISYIMTK